MKNLFHVIFEKNGQLKLFGSLALCIILGIIYALTGEKSIFLWIASPFAAYLVLYFIISMVYAWIVYPVGLLITWLKSLFTKK